MAVMSRLVPLGVGVVAALATAALLAFHVVLAADISQSTPVQITAILAAALEGVVLGTVCWICSQYSGRIGGVRSKQGSRIILASALSTCALAAGISITNLVLLSRMPTDISDPVMGTTPLNFLTGTSVVLGLSFACQIVFIAMHFIWPPGGSDAGLSRAHGRGLPQNVKAIRYSRTMPAEVQSDLKTDFFTPPQSSSGKSATETMSSIRSSLSNAVRPMTSKTRLLSTREKYRNGSLESSPYREGSIATQDSFDSWDTSSVDLQSRMTVLGTTSPAAPHRFLETIPASPTVSRSPSPGHPLDLPLPTQRPRTRSFSPARRSQLEPLEQQAAPGEAHIHPLFRSDSPVPPPNVTAGTVVIAAPEAARVVSDRSSVRRMRSGSLPTRESPLSHQTSYETFRASPSLDEQDEAEAQAEAEAAGPSEERKMTPPIPDWILSAGCRSSLNGYQIRKLRLDPSDASS